MKRIVLAVIATVALAGCASETRQPISQPETETQTNEDWSCEAGPLSNDEVCTGVVTVRVNGYDVDCVRTVSKRFEGGGTGISCNW